MYYKYNRPPAEYEDAPGQLDGLDPLGPVVQVQVQGADQQLVQVHLTLNVREILLEIFSGISKHMHAVKEDNVCIHVAITPHCAAPG